MDSGAWWDAVHGVSKSWTGLSMHAQKWSNVHQLVTRQNVVYPCSGILFSNKRKKLLIICDSNIELASCYDKLEKPYAKWKKPDTIYYRIPCIWNVSEIWVEFEDRSVVCLGQKVGTQWLQIGMREFFRVIDIVVIVAELYTFTEIAELYTWVNFNQ